MSNPTADFPTAVHSPTDVSTFANTPLGATSPTQTQLAGKVEQEIVAIQQKLGIGASTPSVGQVLTATGTGQTAWVTPSGGGGGGGGAAFPAYLVAAVDAPASWLAAANYTCDGTADNTELQSAITAAKADGQAVLLSPGGFTIASTLLFAGTNDPDTGNVIPFYGCGPFQTNLNCANNVDCIKMYNTVKVNMGDFQISVTGTGSGLVSVASASANRRSFWLSSFRNIQVLGPFDGTHTGYAFNLGSPFRSTFMNLEASGTKYGIKCYSEYSDFNPGDCTFDRCFMEIIGTSGVAYWLNGPTGKGLMNQCVFTMCEGIANSNTSTGILIDGAVGGTWNRFYGSNLEQFDTLVNIDTGEGNEVHCNYVECRGANGMTAFKCGTNSWNNIITAKYVYSANTLTLINDGNTAVPDNPNRFESIKVLADTGSTINITRQPSTVTRDIVTEGGGTVSAGVKKFPGVIAPNVLVTLTDGATPALDASLGNHFKLTAAGNRTIGIPSNPTDCQRIIIEHVASGGARTLALNTGTGGFALGGITLSATSSGLTDILEAVYSASANKWRVISVAKGY